jgi:hypothetical protein
MSGKIKILCFVLVAAGVALLGSLAFQKAEGAMRSDIHLMALIQPDGPAAPANILGDGIGPYISGVTPAGTVDIHLDKFNGCLVFYLDKGTSPQVAGRFVNLFFDDPVNGKPCMWMDCCQDSFGYVSVQPQIFRMRTWYIFPVNASDPTLLDWPVQSPTGLNFATMGMTVKSGKTTVTNPTVAYVGMSISFQLTVDGESHHIGGAEYAVKVTADDIGPEGPRHWLIQSLTYALHKDDAADDDRQLYRSRQEFKETVRCSYGWFNFPFQIDLYRK